MKVIFTTNLSDYGNDFYINRQISLAECFGMYAVIIAEKVSGWSKSNKIYCLSEVTCDFDRAKFLFKAAGGKLE